MAFKFEQVTAVELTLQLKLRARPSMGLVKSLDPSFRLMTPFLPWIEVDFGEGPRDVIGADYLELIFADEIVLPLAVVPEEYPLLWPTIRPKPSGVTSAMQKVVTAPVPLLVKPYHRAEFLLAFRASCSSMEEWPAFVATDIECSLATDFFNPPYDACAYAAWIESISVQKLRQADTGRTKGWGLLLFTAHPCAERSERFDGMTALLSMMSRWNVRIQQDQFHGATPAVRIEAFCDEAVQVLFRAADHEQFLKVRMSSVEREREFVSLLNLGSVNEEVSRGAFKEKLVDIIAASEHGAPFRQLMGRTVIGGRAVELYSKLASAFLPGQTVGRQFDLLGFEDLSRQLAPRLAFLLLPEGERMSDEERVSTAVTFREAHSRPLAMVAGAVGEQDDAANQGLRQVSRNLRMEQLHLTIRHQRAVSEIEAVLRTPGSTRQQVWAVVFKQAIPSLNRHLCGIETLSGLEVYDDLLLYQCTKQGSDSEKERALGHFMGQVLLRRDDGSVEQEYHGKFLKESVVKKFLAGNIKALNMEGELLDWIAEVRGGGTLGMVSESKRYLEYVNVDRMIDQISPLFEAFGLGGRVSADSWASLLAEVKMILVDLVGLAEVDQKDLIHGADGLKACLDAALEAAGNTIRKLFCAKDPLVVVTEGRLFAEEDVFFKHLLSLVKIDIAARKSEQRRYKGAYEQRTNQQNQSAEIKELTKLTRKLQGNPFGSWRC
jgi:hypothetical protein